MNAARIADRLFQSTLAPLVLGGTVAPGHAIGAKAAWALGGVDAPSDRVLAERVDAARLRRARTLAPVDAVAEIGPTEWALAAALHDILQAANPTFDAPLRRYAAERILDVAWAAIDRAQPPDRVGEALARHTWFARVFDVKRTDTAVSYWIGERHYLGREPPARLQAWPELRRVNVVRERRDVVDLSPLAVDRERLTQTLAALLVRTPLTDVATCTRPAPQFAWNEPVLSLLETDGGRRLALRALDRLPVRAADAAIGRATRALVDGALRSRAGCVLALLAERAIAAATARPSPESAAPPGDPDALFAQTLGAAAARRAVDGFPASYVRPQDHDALADALGAVAARAP